MNAVQRLLSHIHIFLTVQPYSNTKKDNIEIAIVLQNRSRPARIFLRNRQKTPTYQPQIYLKNTLAASSLKPYKFWK